MPSNAGSTGESDVSSEIIIQNRNRQNVVTNPATKQRETGKLFKWWALVSKCIVLWPALPTLTYR